MTAPAKPVAHQIPGLPVLATAADPAGPEGSDSVELRVVWRDACVSHPAAQQVSREEAVKAHSFVFEPHWRSWPRATNGGSASDREFGLV